MKNTPNCVLFLDAGGPGSMAVMELIKQANLRVRVVAADMNPDCPARHVADVFVPIVAAGSEQYLSDVQAIIQKYNVDLVMPSFHFGYKKLGALSPGLFVGSLDTALLCQDKWLFAEWLVEHGYTTPSTELLAGKESIIAKTYIKPRYGAGAKDNYVVSNDSELQELAMPASTEFLAQDFVEGQHWSVEALRVDGQMVSCSALKVLTHQSGNASEVLLEDNPELKDLCARLLAGLNYEGPANIDVMQTSNDYKIIELNPRFGSTVRFVGAAGRNTPAFLLTGDHAWLAAERHARYGLEGSNTAVG